jgi:hypothetical protein
MRRLASGDVVSACDITAASAVSHAVVAGVTGIAAAVMGGAGANEPGVSVTTQDLSLNISRVSIDNVGEQIASGGTVVDFSAAVAGLTSSRRRRLDSDSSLSSSAVDLRVVAWTVNPYAYATAGAEADGTGGSGTGAVGSGVITVQVGDGGGGGGTLEIANLPSPMQFRVRVADDTDLSSFQCSSWDVAAQVWTMSGMALTLFEEVDGALFAWCTTLHLTDFRYIFRPRTCSPSYLPSLSLSPPNTRRVFAVTTVSTWSRRYRRLSL